MAQQNLIRLFVHTISRTQMVPTHTYIPTHNTYVIRGIHQYTFILRVCVLPTYIDEKEKTCFSSVPPKLSNYRSLLHTPSRGRTIAVYVYAICMRHRTFVGGYCRGSAAQQVFIFRLHERFRCCRRRLFSAAVRISADVYSRLGYYCFLRSLPVPSWQLVATTFQLPPVRSF